LGNCEHRDEQREQDGEQMLRVGHGNYEGPNDVRSKESGWRFLS
jgi:hypothetical protein